MARAIFLSLTDLYPELTTAAQHDPQSNALRNCTCAWWRVNPANAGDVRFAFGVYQGRVVSAYAVRVPASEWPVMPGPAIGEGRRYIPAVGLSDVSWQRALTWRIPMFGPLRYGEVSLVGDELDAFTFPPQGTYPEELEDEPNRAKP
jgi:hypothetical protein